MARQARGTGRLLLAFAVGGAVILAAMRYMPGFTEAVLGTRAATSTGEHTPSREASARQNEARASGVAGRLSYELSTSIDSRNAVSEPRVSPPLTTASPAQPKGPAPDVMPGEYVANARPITAAPPDPRDRTPEIQKESIRTNPRRPGLEQRP